jgi:N-acetylneuraminate lyase
MESPAFRILAATITPFHANGALNAEAVWPQAAWLRNQGVDGVFVAGTTGESSSLTVEERMALLEAWCEASRPAGLDVIAHVGHSCPGDACRLAAHAQSVQADAIAAHSPYFFRPQRVEELIDFLVPVANAASDLPFYLYDIPVMTGVRLPLVALLEKAKPLIPNLVGLKYSNDDLVQLQECVQLHDGEFEVLFGRDEALMAAVSLGACGAVGSTYNFATPLYRRMLAAFQAGDFRLARKEQAKSVEFVRTLERFTFLPAAKALMRMLGVDCGPVRPPLRNLGVDQLNELRELLDNIAFFGPEFLPGVALENDSLRSRVAVPGV